LVYLLFLQRFIFEEKRSKKKEKRNSGHLTIMAGNRRIYGGIMELFDFLPKKNEIIWYLVGIAVGILVGILIASH
jgi:hypothetical protein